MYLQCPVNRDHKVTTDLVVIVAQLHLSLAMRIYSKFAIDASKTPISYDFGNTNKSEIDLKSQRKILFEKNVSNVRSKC